MKTLIALSFLLSTPVFASTSLSAHSHEKVYINMAADGKTLYIGLEAPSILFLGFEHKPKTKKDKKTWQDLKKKWQDNLTNVFSLDSSLKCKLDQEKFQMRFESDNHEDDKKLSEHHAGNPEKEKQGHHHDEHGHKKGKKKAAHSEVIAEVTFKCEKDIKDTELTLALKEHFPKIPAIETTVLPASQKVYSKTIKDKKAKLKL